MKPAHQIPLRFHPRCYPFALRYWGQPIRNKKRIDLDGNVYEVVLLFDRVNYGRNYL